MIHSMSGIKIEPYPASTLPAEYKNAYIRALETRVQHLKNEEAESVRIDEKIARWLSYLKNEKCFVFVLLDGDRPTAFATVLDYSDRGFIRIAELQSIQPQVGDGEFILRTIQRRFPEGVKYGVVHKKSSARRFYAKLGAEEGKYWFPESHPNQRKEDGWIGISFGSLLERKRYLCVILYGEESGLSVGISLDVKAIEAFFQKFKDVSIVKIKTGFINAEGLQNYLRMQFQKESFSKVVIIYSGHAMNGRTSEYPAFECKNRELIRLKEDIHDFCCSLFEFSVVGADCCNSIQVPEMMAWPKAPPTPADMENPFIGSGHLLFSSSKKGQPSFGSGNSGGFFLQTFLSLFVGDWIFTLERVKEKLQSFAFCQEPQWDTQDFVQFMEKGSQKIPEADFPFVEIVQ